MKGEHALGLMGKYGLLSLSLLGTLLANPSAQDVRDMPAAAPLTLDQVVERMVQMNEERSRDLQSFTATRS